MAELCPNFLVPIAPGFQLEEIQSISGYFEVRTVFFSIPDLCHPSNTGVMGPWAEGSFDCRKQKATQASPDKKDVIIKN